jgi:hypothetical protein
MKLKFILSFELDIDPKDYDDKSEEEIAKIELENCFFNPAEYVQNAQKDCNLHVEVGVLG